jgi:hypothetical protein
LSHAQRVVVKVTTKSNSSSAEQVRAITGRKSAHDPPDSCCVALDEHPDSERRETDTAASQERAEDREQDDHRRSIDRHADDLDPSGDIPAHWRNRESRFPFRYRYVQLFVDPSAYVIRSFIESCPSLTGASSAKNALLVIGNARS